MKGIWQDIRYGVRQFRREPGFLSVVVVSLALGIGANSTIFSVLNAVLYRPMPYDTQKDWSSSGRQSEGVRIQFSRRRLRKWWT